MTAIDFTKIRSTPKSRNDSFEALTVQLFQKCCSPPPCSTFISLRGEGGDGGVEAYFRAPDGSVIGVQAKYFFQLSSSELGQIKGSLEAALTNHPTLSEYWVYIPFDLTGKVAGGKRGISQAERFEAWKNQIEGIATVEGKKLTVRLCTAAIIRDQLLACDHHGGMRRYWFDESVLTQTQVQRGLDDAVAFAGPRYTAALDVVTGAHVGLDFFGGIGDFESWREQFLEPVLTALRDLRRHGDEALAILNEPEAEQTRDLLRQSINACQGMCDVSSVGAQAIAVGQMLDEVLPILSRAREAQEEAFYTAHGRECDTPGFRQFNAEYMCTFPAGNMDAARDLEENVRALRDILASPEMGAATTHSLLLLGPAGIGKTHSIVSAALRRLSRNGCSLVVFGDDFRGDEPWEVIRSKLGFGSDVSRATLFECLQSCAENTGLPFVIYVDALNESPRNARWKNKLPEFLGQCMPYPGIKVCVSTRDTYRDLVVDARFPGCAFEHAGFAGQEFEAVQAFATHYGLDAEITPLFSPELSNPLFLHLACRTLRDGGRTSLDVSLAGFAALLDSHLNHCNALIKERLAYANPRNIVRAAMLRLSEVLTHNLPQERTWETCTTELEAIVGKTLPAESLLSELQHEGLVILSAGEQDTWFVRLGYQRYGDILRAISLVDSMSAAGKLDVAALAIKLAKLRPDDDGFMEALAAVLPERTGIEITDGALGLDPPLAHRLFIHALPWRSRDSVSWETHRHLRGALNTYGLWLDTYDAFFRVSLVPHHKLNAANWLSPFLQDSVLVDRDAHLSVGAYKSFETRGAVWSLIHAALKANTVRWPAESRELAVETLAWLTSCTDRRIRDLSSKALTRLLAYEPMLGRLLALKFQGCDDDYVLERIAVSVYSACLLERERKAEFIPALDQLLSPTFDSPNVLIRDSVRLLGHLLRDELNAPLLERLDQFPSRVSPPTVWPTLPDAKPLLDLKSLPTNMQLWGVGMLPDFWRYQVESKISDFDLGAAGISYENIACWIMTETLALGYPGHQQCGLNADRFLMSEFGGGRGRKGYADRLGKKYYWLLMHRLIGILADNVPTKSSYSDWKPRPTHLWSLDVRKADLTDMRDLLLPHTYPDEVVQSPKHVFPDQSSDVKAWVRTDDAPSHHDCIIRRSGCGREWVALSLFTEDQDLPPGENAWSCAYLGVRTFYTAIFFDGRMPSFRQNGAGRKFFDSQGASCYRAYLAEYPDGEVFEQTADEGYFNRGPDGMDFAEVTLSRSNAWEYDYSYLGIERQDSLNVPCQNFVATLRLRWDGQRGWIDSKGSLVAFESHAPRRKGLFVLRETLNAYLALTKRSLVHQRMVTRGHYVPSERDGSMLDIHTWLHYQPAEVPTLLAELKQPFNC